MDGKSRKAGAGEKGCRHNPASKGGDYMRWSAETLFEATDDLDFDELVELYDDLVNDGPETVRILKDMVRHEVIRQCEEQELCPDCYSDMEWKYKRVHVGDTGDAPAFEMQPEYRYCSNECGWEERT